MIGDATIRRFIVGVRGQATRDGIYCFLLRWQANAGNRVWHKIAGADRPFQRPKFSAGLESVVDACRIEENADRILGKFR